MNSAHEKFVAVCLILVLASLLSNLIRISNIRDHYGIHDSQIMNKDDHWSRHETSLITNDPNASFISPRIAWLMSFPNSGTSYTMHLVGRASNRTAASNYGLECGFDKYGVNVPLYSNSPNGPYLLNPHKKLPDNYILTKTHCGGRCSNCGPTKYLETKSSFMEMCAKGAQVSEGNLTKNHVKYDPKLAQRAIHLIRNPFNNIVSNFHLLIKENTKKPDSSILRQRYSNDIDGFRTWCADIDNKYAEQVARFRLLPDSITSIFRNVPCHNSFYVYAQWHNLAIRVIADLRLPSLIIHYEDYETQFNSTVGRIFQFLDISPEGEVPEFITGRQYKEYFSTEEREAAKEIVNKVSDVHTWELVKGYFD